VRVDKVGFAPARAESRRDETGDHVAHKPKERRARIFDKKLASEKGGKTPDIDCAVTLAAPAIREYAGRHDGDVASAPAKQLGKVANEYDAARVGKIGIRVGEQTNG
jgi:hypothetical protein